MRSICVPFAFQSVPICVLPLLERVQECVPVTLVIRSDVIGHFHDMVGCIRKVSYFKYTPKVITCHNYASDKVDSMNSDFERVNWEPVHNADDVNVALNYFNETVKAIFDRRAGC